MVRSRPVISFRVDATLHKALGVAADKAELSRSEWCNQAIMGTSPALLASVRDTFRAGVARRMCSICMEPDALEHLDRLHQIERERVGLPLTRTRIFRKVVSIKLQRGLK